MLRICQPAMMCTRMTPSADLSAAMNSSIVVCMFSVAAVIVTGATAYLADENGGIGPVLLQKAVPVLADDDLTTLKRRVLTDAEWKLLPEAVKCFCAGKIRLHGGRAQILE